jgi:dienelactone hydrolase
VVFEAQGAPLVTSFIRRILAFAALAVLALAGAASAAERRVVVADPAPPPAAGPLTGYLTTPAGAGPFPAIALIHSCLGLPDNRAAFAATLASWGYVALFVDEFAPRGLAETCSVDFPVGPADAAAALAFLARQPFVDGRRLAVIGFSQGGDVALTLAASPPRGLRLRAAAAYYPPCANRQGEALAVPTLVVVGAADSVTPAADCRTFVAAQPPSVARLVVLPGAGHLFDDPASAGGRVVLGMHFAYDGAAAARAEGELRRFLAKTLSRAGEGD